MDGQNKERNKKGRCVMDGWMDGNMDQGWMDEQGWIDG